MKLLDPAQVQVEKDKRDREIIQRTQKLQKEEAETNKRLNVLLENERNEKKLISERLDVMQREVLDLESKIKGLLQEIKELEIRRKKALEPIHEREKSANNLLRHAQNLVEDAEKRREEVDGLFQIYTEKIDSLQDREITALEKDRELDKREKAIMFTEERIRNSLTELNNKWAEFHLAVDTKNKEFTKLKKEIDDQRKVNESLLQSNNAESKRLVQERRAIQDSYIALEKAKEHLGIK